MKHNTKVALIILAVVLVIGAIGIGTYIFISSRTQQTDEAQQSTNNNKTQTNTNTATGVNETGLKLNDGTAVANGDYIEIVQPTYYEGGCSYSGTVINMYPETGRVRFASKLAVVELNYRYVVDIQADKKTCGYAGPDETVMVNQQIRGVVFLDSESNEKIHYIRILNPIDGDENKMGRNMVIDEMVEYAPLKMYTIIYNGDNGGIPQEILDIYYYGTDAT
ncbi:hypothetical protein [Culicoidibacter larvae]|uniref:Uncharacterized protein n=1 Tax=Culicoidibacter larvae TaxID=2579976 RepID=A0A5R8QDH7_9FIRM|nr:hypothetical protein [Culicoidibacter larvae]TLG75281.1 hypothetical protein FEZ08_04335 [Culicoidibacter larvae]